MRGPEVQAFTSYIFVYDLTYVFRTPGPGPSSIVVSFALQTAKNIAESSLGVDSCSAILSAVCGAKACR